ncbi:extracellular solute-binding protein [Cohnella faecalis]|uniref:extracellular solute-binding protein n=1 Tax=Cohnella faecalis TaxID=2315694 RepID=UPI003617E6A8
MKASLIFICLCLLLTVSACRSDEQIAAPIPNEPRSFKIACCDETTFNFQYRDYFDAYYPEWDITLVPLADEALNGDGKVDALRRLLDNEKPDLLILHAFHYPVMANNGMLRDLEELSNRDKADLSSIPQGVVDALKMNDEQKLFGLSPFFHAPALYYNKDMFRKMGIPSPSGPMTWTETLLLANRFMKDERMEKDSYGLHINGIHKPLDLIRLIASTESVNDVNEATGKLTVNTGRWRDIFTDVLTAYAQGTFSTMNFAGKSVDGVVRYGPEETSKMDLFTKGLAAMTVAQEDLMRRLKTNKPGFQWGVVAGPTNSRDGSRGGWYSTGDTFSIPIGSPQPEQAWNVIKTMMSERAGKASVALDEGLFSHIDYPKWKGDPDYKVFYELRPAEKASVVSHPVVPPSFYKSYEEIADRAIMSALQNEIGVEEALSRIQSEAEALFGHTMKKIEHSGS